MQVIDRLDQIRLSTKSDPQFQTQIKYIFWKVGQNHMEIAKTL